MGARRQYVLRLLRLYALKGLNFDFYFASISSKLNSKLQTTIFNLKAQPVWEFGEGFRNELYFNAFGNLLATCGFGNIAAGKVQIWDVEARKEIVAIEVPDTTWVYSMINKKLVTLSYIAVASALFVRVVS